MNDIKTYHVKPKGVPLASLLAQMGHWKILGATSNTTQGVVVFRGTQSDADRIAGKHIVASVVPVDATKSTGQSSETYRANPGVREVLGYEN